VFGGTKVDDASGIAVDATQSVYITGKTQSADYPISTVSFPGLPPMQKLYGGGIDDAFVTKLDSRGLLYDGYSTYTWEERTATRRRTLPSMRQALRM
jgi:Beta-propeller repeat